MSAELYECRQLRQKYLYWPHSELWELRGLTAAVRPDTACALWLFYSSLPTAPFFPVVKIVVG